VKDAFLAALQFMTRIPVGFGAGKQRPYAQPPDNTALFYPLVGALIGGILVAAAALLPASAVSAALVLAIWVLLTGALHLDGLADSADAWLGGFGDREKTLAIMKDSAVGVGGVVALVLILLLKYSALQTVLEEKEFLALLLTPALARALCLALLMTTPYVRENGLGSGLAERLHHGLAWSVIAVAAALYFIAAGFWPAAALGVAAILLRWLMIRRIGGITGDTLGGFIEVIEALALTGLVYG